MRLTLHTMLSLRQTIMLFLLSFSAPLWSQDLDAFLSTEPSELTPAQIEMLSEFTVEIDTVAEDIGELADVNLSGYSTYRIYITTNSELDKVSSVYGNINEPMSINTTGDFFQSSPLGGITPSGIISSVWDDFPSNQFDSFVTIGIDGPALASEGQSSITILESGSNSWVTDFEPEAAINGGSFAIDDLTGGGWFTLPSASNGIAGQDQRVLIAQFTTNGDLSGNLNVQVFLEGDNIGGTVYLPLSLPINGCTNILACNFDEGADTNDGSCIFADEPCESCEGGLAVNNDSDNDGICDDVDTCDGDLDDCGVCNGPGAVYECGCSEIPVGDCDCDGNQVDALGVCGGDCAADADADGVCDSVDDCVGDLDDCGVCNGPGAVYDCGCSEIPVGDCDCDGNQVDALGVCGGDCAADADADGVCDSVDDCVGDLDDCGVCNGPGAVYECGCSEIPVGDCDCDGNQVDALGVCGGDCAADADADGVCDSVDDCVGDLDDCGVCNGPGAVYECGCSEIPDGDCDCDGNQVDALGVCGGDCAADANENGICDSLELDGCTNEAACNYDAAATNDDASCEFESCAGCTETTACNYDITATIDDGSCASLDECGVCGGSGIPDGDCDCEGNQNDALGNCGGDCLEDADDDGVCDTEDTCIGIEDECGVCNGDGPEAGYDCDGNVLGDFCSPACLVLDVELEDQVLDCPEDLDMVSCQTDLTATNVCTGEAVGVSCGVAARRLTENVCNATTAMGIGEDGAIVLFGVENFGLNSTYYVPTAAGLTLTEYPNSNTAVLEGEVRGTQDASEIWEVYITYENGVTGADWTGGYKTAMDCMPTSDVTDSWTIYTMKNDQSFLTGSGALEGSLLFLNHAPFNEYFGFQVGDMANDRNCDYGAGGWFAWEGQILGQPASGANGDVLVNLDCTINSEPLCDDQVILTYSLVDTACATTVHVDQTFTFLDTIAPTFDNAPGDVTMECSEALPPTTGITASDNCTGAGDPTVTFNGEVVTAFTAPGCQTIERSWIAADACNNTTSHTQIITIIDTAPPVISGGDNALVECDGEGNQTELSNWLSSHAGAEATDLCGDVSWSYVMASMTGGCGETGSVTYTFTATDECGNASDIDFDFVIEDTTAPSMSGPQDYDIACADYDENTIYDITTDDSCGEVSLTIDSVQIVTGTCPRVAYTTYRAEDECGNVAYYEQAVNLIDTIAPVVTLTDCPDDIQLEVDADCIVDTTVATLGMPTASVEDACDDAPTLSFTHSDDVSSTCTGAMTIVRTWTAIGTDECENTASATCIQTITVLDLIAPELSIACPADTVLYADANCAAATGTDVLGLPQIDAADACGGSVELNTTYADSDTTSSCEGAYAFVRTFTVTATDECGNMASATCAQSISIEDNTAPMITVSDTIQVACDTYDPAQLYAVSAADNCSAVALIIDSQTDLDEGCAGSILRTYRATDDCGNTSTADQLIQLTDDVAPEVTIECPAGDSLQVDAACFAETGIEALGSASADATDNCDEAPAVSISHSDAIETPCAGSQIITRTWTAVATDHCNNTDTATCEQIIVVQDLIAPELSLTCPADTLLLADENCNANTDPVALGIPMIVASDNCTGMPAVSMSHSDSDSVSTCVGNLSFTRTWTATATDDCGNQTTESCEQTISIEDQTVPVLTGEAMVTMACDVYEDDALYAVDATDNCSEAAITVLTNNPVSGACAGSILRIYQATDDCGNSATFEQVINLTDSVAPEVSISCPASDSIAVDADCLADISVETLGMATGSATDNCDENPEVSISHSDVFTDLCIGSQLLERSWMAVATDHCGNTDTTTCVQTILIQDLTAPEVTITCPADASVEADALCDASTLPSITGEPTYEASDNCGGPVEVSISHADHDTIPGCGNTYAFTRTWTAQATDDCGNMALSSCDQTITLVDVTAPDWGNSILYTYAACEDLLDPEDPTLVPIEATDNCSDVTYTISAMALSGGCPGTFERIWTATDACGNSSSFGQYVSLYDIVDPEIGCPSDTVLVLDEDCAADLSTDLLGFATADDNCSAPDDITITYADEAPVVDCTGDDDTPEGSRTILRTFTAEDFCENTTSCTQTITLLDTLAPVGTVTTETIACAEFDSTVEYGTASGMDNCDSDVAYTWVEDGVVSTICQGSYEVQRTYTFVDDCGNASTAIQLLTIVDETAPEVTGDMNVSIACDAYGSDDADPNNILISATDDCGEVTITFTDMPFSGGCVQPFSTLMRDYTVSDDCGNTTMFTQFITLVDTVAPVLDITCPADMDLFSDASCMTNADTSNTGVPSIEVTDNCSANIDVSIAFEDGPLETTCVGSYSFTRTFTVTAEDNCENTTTASCTQLISVSDTIAPGLTCAEDLTVECDGNGNEEELAAWLNSATATDNCSDVSITHDFDALTDDCGATGGATVVFTATDACGNATSCSATFTISDSQAPEITTAAADLTVQCDGQGNTDALDAWLASQGGAVAADVCSDASWSHDFAGLESGCGATGSASVTFTATDDCGHATSTTAAFAIVDTIAPDFTGSAFTYNIACDLYDETSLYDIAVDDVCAFDTVYVSNIDPVSGGCPTGYLRTYTALDACGNSSIFQQAITLVDSVAPVFTEVPADYVALCHEDHPLEDASATDNCDDDVTITVSADTTAGDCPQSYTVTRTFTAEDECDNMTTATQVIQVVDTLAPTFVEGLPGDTTVDCHTVPAADVLTASDLCGDVEVTFTEDTTAGDCANAYTLTRSWSTVDACGNATEHTQVLTVQDTLAPSIDTPAMDLTVECDGLGNVFDYLTWQSANASAEASDLCGSISWSSSVDSTFDDCDGAVGGSIVTFTATDACGNSASTSATYTIQDTQAPVIELDSLVEVMCADYSDSISYGFSASDICSDVTVAIMDTETEGPCAGAYEREYTVTDACGNAATATQIVHLYDSIAPIFSSVPMDTTIQCGGDFSIEALGTPEAEDNCLGSVTISSTDAIVDSTGADCYTINRLWTATDICGNEKSVTQNITISDSEAPELSASYPADLTLEADATCNAATGTGDTGEASATATDNCDTDVEVAISYADSTSSDCGSTFTIHRTWSITATDNCGNASSDAHVQTISVIDVTAPTLSALGPDSQTLSQTADCNVYTGVDSLGTVNYDVEDACDPNPMVTITHTDGPLLYTCASDDSLAEGDYTFTRTFTVIATDACGNADTVTVDQTIEVLDQIAPQFTNTCGLDNGTALSVCCEDMEGTVTVPEACEVSFQDNCDSEVSLTFTESYLGDNAPTDEVTTFCSAALPAAFEDGETCNGMDPHSLRLFNIPGGAELYTPLANGSIELHADGTWVLSQSVVALDGSGDGWDVTATFGAAMDWTEWDNQAFPTSYKRDCGDLVDDHENWDYRLMESGTLTGTGNYAGSTLSLVHAPANNYYAFQIGMAANNMNDNYGYSGWFSYSGTFNGNFVMGSGDLFGDLDCCLPWSIEREYLLVDDCGNTASFEYTVEVNGEACTTAGDAELSGNSGVDHTPSVLGGAGDITVGKSPIRVTNLQPNPTNDWSQLGFEVESEMRVVISMFSMDGVLVTDLYDGFAAPGVNHSLDIPADDLQSGMYQIRLSNAQYMIVKKLLVTE